MLHPSGFYPTSFENEADLTRDRDTGNEDNARVFSFPSRTPGDPYPRGAFAVGVFPTSTSFAVISAVYDKVSFLWVVSTADGAEARASNKKTGVVRHRGFDRCAGRTWLSGRTNPVIPLEAMAPDRFRGDLFSLFFLNPIIKGSKLTTITPFHLHRLLSLPLTHPSSLDQLRSTRNNK